MTSNPALNRTAVAIAQRAIDSISAKSVLSHPSLANATEEQVQYVLDRVLDAKAVLTSG